MEFKMPSIIATVVCNWLVSTALVFGAGEQPYDFRKTPQYAALSQQDRRGLETVHRDITLLWGALDMYADDHNGQAPKRLDDLVPLYLRELPKDPFATNESSKERNVGSYSASREGWGYRYRQGTGSAWVIASVGLHGFPYLAERGNVDLYKAKGFWTGGGQLVR